MSDEYTKLLEEERNRLLAELAKANERIDLLTGMLFQQAGLLHEETEIKVPSSVTGMGKEPWHVRQKRLEKAFRVPAVSSVAPESNQEISEEE